MPICSGSRAIQSVHVGSAPATGVYVGSTLVWPPKIDLIHDFAYAGNTSWTKLSTASGGLWTNYDDNGVWVEVNSRRVLASERTTNSTYWPQSRWTEPFNKFDVSVSIRLQENVKAEKCGLFIGANESGDSYLQVDVNAGSCWLTTGTARSGRSGWSISGAANLVAGDLLTLTRRTEGSLWRLIVSVNGVQVGNILTPPLSMSPGVNHNVAGIVTCFRRESFKNYYAAAINEFRIETI